MFNNVHIAYDLIAFISMFSKLVFDFNETLSLATSIHTTCMQTPTHLPLLMSDLHNEFLLFVAGSTRSVSISG